MNREGLNGLLVDVLGCLKNARTKSSLLHWTKSSNSILYSIHTEHPHLGNAIKLNISPDFSRKFDLKLLGYLGRDILENYVRKIGPSNKNLELIFPFPYIKYRNDSSVLFQESLLNLGFLRLFHKIYDGNNIKHGEVFSLYLGIDFNYDIGMNKKISCITLEEINSLSLVSCTDKEFTPRYRDLIKTKL